MDIGGVPRRRVPGAHDHPVGPMSSPELFTFGPVTLSSGRESDHKFDLDALTDATVDHLARWAADRLRFVDAPVSGIEGVPTGGLRFAAALSRYVPVDPAARRVLIVDDVLTTGGSMERQRAGREAVGLVILDRSPLGVVVPPWIDPMLRVGHLFRDLGRGRRLGGDVAVSGEVTAAPAGG